MLNTVYRLVAPRRFEVAFNDIDLNSDKVVVRPTHLSICHADQRYIREHVRRMLWQRSCRWL